MRFGGVCAVGAGLIAVAIGLVNALVVTGYGLMLASVPPKNATYTGMDIPNEVDIRFSETGIPTIRARTMDDAYFALGFLHARDRLWQAEAMRRTGSGRLAAVLGASVLRFDRYMRTLGFERRVEAQFDSLPAEVRRALERYAAGFNAWLAHRDVPLPPEFQLTFHSPAPWRPTDSLLWGKIMALFLSGNARQEELRADIVDLLGPEKAEALFPAFAKGPPSIEPGELVDVQGYDASNAWVISGDHTESGSPILANDPHLGLGLPGQWYLVRIETPELTLTGATSPGVPFHVLGHNGQAVWGLTTTHADTQDLVLLGEDALANSQRIEDVIDVRFGEPERITIIQSEYGPVLPDRQPATALKWSALDGPDRTPEALYRINRAMDWDGFDAALRLFDAPMQNIFYADTNGRIGMGVPGRLPIRRAGHDGRLPVHSDHPYAKWDGIVQAERMPRAPDPVDGILFNANNKVVGTEFPHLVAADWPADWRAKRLRETLSPLTASGAPAHRPSDSMALQTDILSVAAREALPAMIEATLADLDNGERDPQLAEALKALGNWDYRMDRQSDLPGIYTVWVGKLAHALVADDLAAATDDANDAGTTPPDRPDPNAVLGAGASAFVTTALTERQAWCDDVATATIRESCSALARESLADTLDHLAETLGPQREDWRWGRLHTAPMKHRLFDFVPGLAQIANRPIETDGGQETLNRGNWRPYGIGAEFAPKDFSHVHGAGFRAVYDLSDLDSSRFALAGGQSGHPLSDHYADLLEDWRDSRYFRIPGRGNDIENANTGIVILRPVQ